MKAAEDLKAKIESAKQQKERDIEQKISERESLISEDRKNNELLCVANETLDYFESMAELGNLDEVDKAKLEELRLTVQSLGDQRIDIERRIEVISNNPDINSRMHDAANKEDIEFTANSIFEQACLELEPRIDNIVEAINAIAARRKLSEEMRQMSRVNVSAQWDEIGKTIDYSKKILNSRSDFGSEIDNAYRSSSRPEELIQKLSTEKDKLGMFKGKEKAAIDHILKQERLFENFNNANERLNDLEKEKSGLEGEMNDLAVELKDIIKNSWEEQNKIMDLLGRPGSNNLPSHLHNRLGSGIEKCGNLQRWEGGKQVGKYNNWSQVGQSEGGGWLYGTWKKIEEDAGGIVAIYRNPRIDSQEGKVN
jgi:hypothetical protein